VKLSEVLVGLDRQVVKLFFTVSGYAGVLLGLGVAFTFFPTEDAVGQHGHAEHGSEAPHGAADPAEEGHAGDDASSHSTKVPKKRAIQSFGRFESNLKQMCAGLDLDGRRERLFNIAIVQKKEERACPLCRSLWGTVAGACKPAPKKEPPKKKKKDEEEVEAEPTPTPKPQVKQRYPAPVLLDLISRMADGMYEAESDDKAVRRALDSIVTAVMSASDLSIAEREYFETLFAFLTAPWEGREDLTHQRATPTPDPSVDEMFE
jgi:hypothetical protein